MLLVHIDLFASSRVPSQTRVPPFDGEGAKAPQFHPIATRHRVGDLLEYGVNEPLDVTPKQVGVFISDKLDQFGADHRYTSFERLQNVVWLNSAWKTDWLVASNLQPPDPRIASGYQLTAARQ